MDRIDRIQELLTDSINDCISSADGPVAVQLSGGLDSALIQAIAKVDRLYCVTFPDDGVDNYTTACLAACGAPVVPVTFTRDDMLDVLPEVAKATDGRGTWSQVCQYFMNKKIAEDGATTVLTGEGADELFWGYSRYRILHHMDDIWQDPKLEAYHGIADDVLSGRRYLLARMLSRNIEEEVAWDLTEYLTGNYLLVEEAARIDFNAFLPDLLRFGAQMAEIHGLDCEFPFIEDRIVDFAQELLPVEKINDDESKAILRDLARRLGVADEIINEQTKKGLFVPPSWGPDGTWGRGWFTDLMRKAHGQS
jgi:asparagine synthase (glutamine-hydrolysing)